MGETATLEPKTAETNTPETAIARTDAVAETVSGPDAPDSADRSASIVLPRRVRLSQSGDTSETLPDRVRPARSAANGDATPSEDRPQRRALFGGRLALSVGGKGNKT